MKQILMTISILSLLCSCTKMPLYTAVDWDEGRKVPTQFHGKDQVKYSIQNDQDHLVVTMITADPVTQMKILRNGLELHLDPDGKKAHWASITFPYKTKEPRSNRPLIRPNSNVSRLDIMIARSSTAALWKKESDQIVFNILDSLKPADITLNSEQGQALVLRVEIPVRNIEEFVTQHEPSMGITISGMGNQNNLSGNRRSGVPPGRVNGKTSGRGGPGGQAGSRRPSNPGSSRVYEMNRKITEWFKVKLYK